tara:strand:+ start:1419 stop:2150 length:732 start_codon:yes stop_codon:yes gene_type:complete
MTILEIIQRVQQLYSKGVDSSDSRLRKRHIYNKLLTTRSRLISQLLNQKRKLSRWDYQVLPCVELIKVPKHLCPCVPPLGCTILRSKHKIPQPINTRQGDEILFVSTLDGTVEYSKNMWETHRFKHASKYTKHTPEYFILDDYIWVIGKNQTKVLTMTYLAQDPLEIEDFKSYCNDLTDNCGTPVPCIDCEDCEPYYNKEFRIDDDKIDTLVEMSFNELIGIFNQNREDRSGNSRDNTIQETK